MNSGDDKLLRYFRKGNPEAFAAVFQHHKNQIYNFAYKMLGEKEGAADVTQEVFIKLFQSQNNAHKINSLKNWLFTVARNLCLNKIRDRKRETGLDSLTEEESTGNEVSILSSIKLRNAMIKLEPNLKEALILREYQDFSYAEISKILGLSVSGVKSLLFRARLRLKETFERTN